MKTLLLATALSSGLLLASCAFTEQQKVDQLLTTFQCEDSGKVAASFYEALAAGNDDEYGSLIIPTGKQDRQKLKAELKKDGEPVMRGFSKWSSSPAISTVKNLDATPEFPGPFYVVERTAAFADGGEQCLIAVVEFKRGGSGYVSSFYRGKTRGDARKHMREAFNNAG